jgi:homoserine kinase
MNEAIETADMNELSGIGLRSVEVRVPASTSNLGAGFDCFGLALQLYLTVRATTDFSSPVDCPVRIGDGKENAGLLLTRENLIYRSMTYVAEREAVASPPAQLTIDNEIPISRGLGGSAAAIVGGIKLFELLCNRALPQVKVLQYATELDGHSDNASAALLGGFTISCSSRQGQIIAVKREWPTNVKLLVVIPELQLETKLARAALPRLVNHVDAVFNLQRAALFSAALTEGAYDLLWEAMQDRLHQEKRATLVPGLAEALSTPRMPGLLGVALSGAGPSVMALVQENFEEIGATIAGNFERQGIVTQVRQLEIDTSGCRACAL